MIRLISISLLMVNFLCQCPSKQVMTSNGLCMGCHYTCSQCNALTERDCSSCELEYYMTPDKLCSQCPLNCRICNNSASCTSCNTGFYVDYSQQCQPCANGTLTCTMSSIGLCKPGFFLSNLGYSHCVVCAAGCLECASSTACATCLTGYLSNGLCLNCSDPNCLSCYGSDYCQTCIDGRSTDQYGKCNIECAVGCKSCVSPTVCMECLPMYYLIGYDCIPGGNILCQSNATVLSCISGCLESVAYMSITGNVCIVRSTINITTRQYYLSASNSLSNFWQAQLLNCFPNPIASVEGQLLVLQAVAAGYSVLVTYQIYILSIANETKNYTVNSPFSQSTQQSGFSPSWSTAYSCNQYSYVFSTSSRTQFNISTKFNSSVEPFQVRFSTSRNSAVGISQLIVSVSLCGVANCGSCSTSKDCLACQPPYLLEINTCVAVCSFGLYTNPTDRSCLVSCPDLYYALRQQYLCVLCVSPCKTCTSQTACTSCINGTYLNSNRACVSDCGDPTLYGNPLTLKCQSCIYPCKYCNGSGVRCMGCLIGFLNVLNNTCTLKCPDGFYGKMDTLMCDMCVSPCQHCLMTNITCTSCITGLSLSEGQCLSSCPSRTFSLNGICQSCQEPCRQCSVHSTLCTSCKRGFLLNSTCLERCPSGTYGASDVKTCSNCHEACTVCQGPTALNCGQCQSQYILFQTTCLTTCPDGYYNRSGYCQFCASPCLYCFNSSACKSCQPSLYLFNSTCNLACPNGSYAPTGNSFICLSCPANCSQCMLTNNAVSCTICSVGFFLQNTICNLNCSQFTFINVVERRCDSCAQPCLTCSNNVDQCTSCVSGYSLLPQQGSCYLRCPTKYYKDANLLCTACPHPCYQCTNSTTCTSCVLQTYFSNGSCITTCPNGTYASDNTLTCVLCSLPCLTCLSQQLCLSCAPSSGYPFLYSHSCVNSCPSGSIGQSSLCLPCSTNCEACSIVPTNCTSCTEGYYLQATNASCLAVCPDGYFASNAINSCSPCKQMCLKCITYSYCTSCTTSPKAYLFDSGCGYSCPSGYYQNTTNPASFICSACHINCTQCSQQPNNCTVCKAETFMPVGQTSTVECLSGCPALAFAFNSTCIACSSPCQQCTSPDLCITCLDRYLLFNRSCLTLCPSAYFNNSGVCQPCQLPCSQCSIVNTNCTECTSAMMLYNNTCLLKCPSHYYASSITNICFQCSPLCLECIEFTTCTSCNTSTKYFLLQASSCVQSCSQSHYLLNRTCINCSVNCVECTNSSTCISCTSAYLYNGYCVRSCPNTTYPDISLKCLGCQQPCETCLDSQTCLTCIEGYLLYLTYCITKCPNKYWADRFSRRCVIECDSKLYRNSNTMECFKTCPRYYTSDSYCVDSCPSIVNSTMGCEECSGPVCNDLVQFKAMYLTTRGKMMFAILFSRALTQFENVTATLFSISLQSKIYIESETETIQRRLLLSKASLAVDQVGPFSLWLSATSGSIQTSLAAVSLTNQTLLQRNNYPLQNVQSDVEVNYYRTYDQQQATIGQYFLLIGRYIGYLVVIGVAVNYLLDNCRAALMLMESVQIYYFISYLKIWYCPALEKLLEGFESACFRIQLPFDFQLMLWNSPAKNLLLSTDINIFRNCLGTLFCCIAFFGLSFVLKVICQRIGNKNLASILKHEICWNHINDAFWLFGFNLGMFALFQLLDISSSVSAALLASILIIVFVVVAMLLFYTTVKCVFNKSFSEPTFFWNLDTTNIKNSLGHMPTPLFLLRRIIIVFSIGIAGQNPLYCVFLLIMVNLLIIFNNIINAPYKRHSVIITLKEVVFVAVVLLLGSLTIFTMYERTSWVVGLATCALILLNIILGLWVVVVQTYRAIKKIRQKIWPQNRPQNYSIEDKNQPVQLQNRSEETSQEVVSIFEQGQKSKTVKFMLPQDIPKLNLQERSGQEPVCEPDPQLVECKSPSSEALNVIMNVNMFSSDDEESDGFRRPAEYLVQIIKEDKPQMHSDINIFPSEDKKYQ